MAHPRQQPAPPTQAQLASELGLSQSTVTLALQAKGRVSPQTRQRVLEHARNRGYLRNNAASRLANQRYQRHTQPFNLAYLTVDPNSTEDHVLPTHTRERAHHFGYGFEFLNLNELKSLDSLPRILRARGVAGVILATQGSEGRYLQHPLWQQLELPAVALYTGSSWLPFHRVSSDAHREAFHATRTAIERGYERIGLLLPQRSDSAIGDRLKLSGYLTALYLHPPKESPFRPIPPLHYDLHRPLEKPNAIGSWVRRHRLDCVVSYGGIHDETLTHARLRIPEQIALACTFVQDEFRHVTGYRNPAPQIARSAVRLLDSFIRHPADHEHATNHRTLLVKQRWHEGVTLPHKSASTAAIP